MYLVEQHIITVNDKRYKDLDRICFLSKNLYNAALHIIKQEFLSTGKWIRAVDLNKKMVAENNIDYRAMSGSSSQQVLMVLDKNLKSYFSAIKAWKRDNKKFTGCPKFPKYKHKTKGRNVFSYSYAQFKHRGDFIYFPKKEGLSPLKTNCKEGHHIVNRPYFSKTLLFFLDNSSSLTNPFNVIITVTALASQYSSPGSDPYVTNPELRAD